MSLGRSWTLSFCVRRQRAFLELRVEDLKGARSGMSEALRARQQTPWEDKPSQG